MCTDTRVITHRVLVNVPSSGYDKASVESIYEHAHGLIGRNLNQTTSLPEELLNTRNRGDLGRLVEKYYFHHNPPNDHEPDFRDAGLELKTTGIVRYVRPNRNGEIFRAKERLVLNIIDYQTLPLEGFESSSFLHKCNLMLILFYEYDRETSVSLRKFVLDPLLIAIEVDLFNQSPANMEFVRSHAISVTENDLQIIKRDWETIRRKVEENKAHELSEGDTNYLGACRKGSGGESESLRRQFDGVSVAKARAFSLKQGFVTMLVHGQGQNYVSLGAGENLSLEEVTSLKFQEYIGLTEFQIARKLNYDSSSKSRKSLLAKLILTAKKDEKIEEFEKAGIQLKTIAISKSGRNRESMSFPAFKAAAITNQNWEESDFSFQIEARFLFVVFQEDENGEDRLKRVLFWTMPFEDRQEAKRVWEDAKHRLQVNPHNLPRGSESTVAHVRPHARNSRDTDRTPEGIEYVKSSFWLNNSYIARVVGEN